MSSLKGKVVTNILEYFTQGLAAIRGLVGMEVETSFLQSDGRPAEIEQTQGAFKFLLQHGWRLLQTKGQLITVIEDNAGNKILYELGRQNIELSSAPQVATALTAYTRSVLGQVYCAAGAMGLVPYFGPILDTNEDLLVVPDERDANWILLDGRQALAPLAKTSAVQFTIEVEPGQAIEALNRLGSTGIIDSFLCHYPQEMVWREYIRASAAGYHPLRYGGPLQFGDLADYCAKLMNHDVVQGPRLVPHSAVENLDVPLFIRSVWWYFRLRRYGESLCIEVRPIARRSDYKFEDQLGRVLNIMNL